MAVWPATLPQAVLADGFAEAPPLLTIEQKTDAGTVKERQHVTTASRFIPLRLPACTAAQVETFDAFLLSTVSGGALEFDWVHPRTEVAATCKISARTVRYKKLGGVYWDISFTLEVRS